MNGDLRNKVSEGPHLPQPTPSPFLGAYRSVETGGQSTGNLVGKDFFFFFKE